MSRNCWKLREVSVLIYSDSQIKQESEKVRIKSQKVRIKYGKVRIKPQKVRKKYGKVRIKPQKVRKRHGKARKSTDKTMGSTEKVRKSTDKLKDYHKKVIGYIEKNGAITNKEAQNLLNVKDSRALKILREMVEAGVLKKEGKLRGSYYKLR